MAVEILRINRNIHALKNQLAHKKVQRPPLRLIYTHSIASFLTIYKAFKPFPASFLYDTYETIEKKYYKQ